METVARELRRRLPMPVKRAVRGMYHVVLDLAEGALGLRDDLTPPRRMIFVGDGDFKKTGEEFLRYFVDLGGLRPDDKVLDVGSGIGRMAVPLTRYLSSRGEYWGIDIVTDGTEWCKRTITPRFPNFHFEHADVYNGLYNPQGSIRAQDYEFPFGAEHFNFVFLTSVFTHMLPPDFERYISETSRVLLPGGKAFTTLFLMNMESRGFIRRGEGELAFKQDVAGYWTIDSLRPERAIAYDEESVQRLYGQHGLELKDPINFGSWCGRSAYLSFQDIILARKVEVIE